MKADKGSEGKKQLTGRVLVKTHQKGHKGQLHTVVMDAGQGHEMRISQVLYGKVTPPAQVVGVGTVRKGLPLGSIRHVSQSLKLEEGELLHIIGISPRTLQRRRQAHKHLDLIESDRLYRLAKIQARAVEVFNDEEIAVDWLKAPNRALGEKPLNLLDTEAGTDMVERVLTRIEQGVYS